MSLGESLFHIAFRYLTSEFTFSFYYFVLSNVNSLNLCHEGFSISYHFCVFSALSAVMMGGLSSVAGHLFCVSYKGISFDKRIICPS